MTEVADRYRKIAGEFTARAAAVPAASWENPAPCERWVARDIVRHLVEWLPAFFFGTWEIDAIGPSADDDPLGAWLAVDRAIQSALDDPEVAGRERDTRMGRTTFEQTIATICTPDILIHTWDLARATGGDETLDTDAVHEWVVALEPSDQLLRDSGHYGPRVAVPADADEQTRLLAFLGRRP